MDAKHMFYNDLQSLIQKKGSVPFARYPDSTIGGSGTFVTDKQGIEGSLGNLPEDGAVVKVTRSELDKLESNLGLRPNSLESGSVIREKKRGRYPLMR